MFVVTCTCYGRLGDRPFQCERAKVVWCACVFSFEVDACLLSDVCADVLAGARMCLKEYVIIVFRYTLRYGWLEVLLISGILAFLVHCAE